MGLGLVDSGQVGVSLGTSDTLFGTLHGCRVDPSGESHVFFTPAGHPLSLICFKNGSLARERIRDRYRLDWKGFSAALEATPPGNRGAVLLPYFEPEIVPRVLSPGVHRFDLDEADPGPNCRAVVEAQMISMRLHSRWMKVRPTRIHATGGASRNREILQILADVHECPVVRIEVENSAALGAGFSAASGFARHQAREEPYGDLAARFLKAMRRDRVDPDPSTRGPYRELLEKYERCEASILERES